jgi:CRISPR-associated protein Csb2
MWVVAEGEEPEPNWIPGEGVDGERLRVPARGTLGYLEAAMNAEAIEKYDDLADKAERARGRERQRLRQEMAEQFPNGRPKWRRPQLVHWQAYGRPLRKATDQTVLEGPFDENIIVLTKLDGPALGLESTLQLTRALRNRAMEGFGAEAPEWLSGHDETGAVSQHPHVAFFPLPYVGFPHADGHVMGLGMAIPRELKGAEGSRDEELKRVLGPLFFDVQSGEEREIRIWKKGVWEWTLGRERRERPPLTLQGANWTKPSRIWASVTPVVLHHYPKKREGDIERIVREAFGSARLPEPELVAVGGVSVVQGVGHAMSAPVFREGGEKLCPYQTHAVVRFGQLVRGPVLVGRGRYRGYGLFRPLSGEEAERWMR